MQGSYNIPVVVVAYNRPASIKRLLESLANADYTQEVRLIISIDKSENKEVSKIADNFIWNHGPKEVIEHKENLGLREHILYCGGLSLLYDAVIVLEDDLYVSPGFYSYTLEAYKFFHQDKNIGGISLYSHNYNETAKLPFSPLIDEADSFFMQIPSSWGQCWSREQWQEFSKWYKSSKDQDISAESGLPDNVVTWPKTSWKKYFYKYLVNENKFFVYPRFSASTNFGDPGVHFPKKLYFQQVPLLMNKKSYNFKSLSDSYVIYDSHCEILPDSINLFQPRFKDFDYTVDLYGSKNRNIFNKKYILTTKACSSSIFSFARDLKPIECNILMNIPGNDIFLAENKSCMQDNQTGLLSDKQLFYFFGLRESQLRYDKQLDTQIAQKNKQIAENKAEMLEKDKTIERFIEIIDITIETYKQKRNSIVGINEILGQKLDKLEECFKDQDIRDTTRKQMHHLIIQAREALMKEQNILVKPAEIMNWLDQKIKSAGKISNTTDIIDPAKYSRRERNDNILSHKETRPAKSINKIDSKTDLIERIKNLIIQNTSNKTTNEAWYQEVIAILEHYVALSESHNQSLLYNQSELEKKSGQLSVIEERLAEKEQLIKSIEHSYTFRIGKAILWPVRKITGRS